MANMEKPKDKFPGVRYGNLEDDSGNGLTNPFTPRRYSHKILIAIVILIIGSVFGGAVYWIRCSSVPKLMNDCGNSSAMAISRGCKMEPTIYGWIPPQCFYEELTAEYPVFHDRTWYRDPNMTEQITVDQLERGEFTNIYTRKFHTEHCLFMWRKLGMVVSERKEWVDNKTLSFYHAKHCVGQLIDGYEEENSVSNAELGTYKCMPLNWA